MSCYRARVTETTSSGVFVTVQRGWNAQTVFGPCPTLVPDLEPGTDVLVGELDGRRDRYVVLGPFVPPVT